MLLFGSAMDAGLIERIETGAERSASALFAAAVGYAAYGIYSTTGLDPQLGLGAAGVGALAYLPCVSLLRGAHGVGHALPAFTLPELDFEEPADELLLTEQLDPGELLLTERASPTDELMLTDADRVDAVIPLVLEDILEEIGPDSRVVRLFDRKAMPTAGQLQSRIASHMGTGASRPAPAGTSASSDASQALSAALAELRRSLR